MSKNLTNDQIIKNVKIRKILKYIIILVSISTIVLAILSLIIKLNPIYAVISFVVEILLNKLRDKYAIK